MGYYKPFRLLTSLVIFSGMLILLNACSKGKKPPVPSILSPLDSTHKLAGTWPMRGFEDTNQLRTYDSTYLLHDTAIVITVVNDSTITINNLLFNYTKPNSNDSMFYFWHVFHGSIFEEASVSYYFRRDSIVFEHLILVIPNGYQEKFYHTH